MQTLYKYMISCDYANQHSCSEFLNSYGISPIWNFSHSDEISYSYFYYSYNSDIETHLHNPIVDNGSSFTITPIKNVNLPLNCPSNISIVENGDIVTMTQTANMVVPPISYDSTIVTTFNSSTNVVDMTNTLLWEDTSTGAESETNVVLNPDGTTTSTTNTDYPDGTTSITTQEYNGTGNVSYTSTETQNPDGSSSLESTTYNDNGTLANEYSYTGNSDGSSESHSTNYDDNGNPTDGENQWIDTSGNENTQSIEYDDNGDPEVVGYTIDTTNNGGANDGEQLPSGGIDTGVLAFDGRNFDIMMKANIPYYSSATNGKTIAPLIVMSSRVDGYVRGLVLFQYCPNSGSFNCTNIVTNEQSSAPAGTVNLFRIQMYNSVGGVDSKSSKNFGHSRWPNYYQSGGYHKAAFTQQNGTQLLTFYIRYRNGVIDGEIWRNGSLIAKPEQGYTWNMSTFSTNDITIELGHWNNQAGTEYNHTFEVIELQVYKL